jgi:hypothetical protein
MHDVTSTTREPDGLGVVDPIRIPGAARAGRAWNRLPSLAKVFVALTAIDVAMRALGLFGTSLYLDLSSPLSLVAAFLPHDALILLPAILAWRRPNAVEAVPLVMRGAILVALVELLNAPLRGVASGNPLDPVVGPTVVSIAAIFLTAAGWISIALGLRGLNPEKPEASTAGLGNVVGGAIALGAILNLAGVLLLPGPDVGEPRWNALVQLNSAMLTVQTFALAYLAMIVALGTDDERRPKAARYTGTGAVVLLAIGAFVTAVIELIALSQAAFAQSIGIGGGPIWLAIGLLTGPVAMTAFVVAFGLGLADASGRDPSVTIGVVEQPHSPTAL